MPQVQILSPRPKIIFKKPHYQAIYWLYNAVFLLIPFRKITQNFLKFGKNAGECIGQINLIKGAVSALQKGSLFISIHTPAYIFKKV